MGPLSIRIQFFMTLLDVFLARCVLPAASENQTPPNENAFSQKFETWRSCFFETPLNQNAIFHEFETKNHLLITPARCDTHSVIDKCRGYVTTYRGYVFGLGSSPGSVCQQQMSWLTIVVKIAYRG